MALPIKLVFKIVFKCGSGLGKYSLKRTTIGEPDMRQADEFKAITDSKSLHTFMQNSDVIHSYYFLIPMIKNYTKTSSKIKAILVQHFCRTVGVHKYLK